MDARTGQLTCIVIGRDVQVMFLCHHFDTAYTVFYVNRTFNIRAAIIFQPKVDWNCHNSFSIFTSLMRHHLAVTVPSCPAADRHQPAVPD